MPLVCIGTVQDAPFAFWMRQWCPDRVLVKTQQPISKARDWAFSALRAPSCYRTPLRATGTQAGIIGQTIQSYSGAMHAAVGQRSAADVDVLEHSKVCRLVGLPLPNRHTASRESHTHSLGFGSIFRMSTRRVWLADHLCTTANDRNPSL